MMRIVFWKVCLVIVLVCYPEKRKAMIALWEQYKVENGVLDIDMDLSGNEGVK